jgi:DNA invertase Pin-like site-specific DNA recombinase
MGLKSLQDLIDTSSPGGKLISYIFTALAEFEYGVIRDRTSVGLKRATAGDALVVIRFHYCLRISRQCGPC